VPYDKRVALMAEVESSSLRYRLRDEIVQEEAIERTGDSEMRRMRRLEIIGEIDGLLTQEIEILTGWRYDGRPSVRADKPLSLDSPKALVR
jgi:hypothetical protein